MTFASEYPELRYMLPNAAVRREVLLPGGVKGTLAVRQGQRVDMNTVIARGQLPSRHYIVEAAEQLRLRSPDDLTALLLVGEKENVEAGQVIAGRNPNRGRRVRSPVTGRVASVDAGRIIVRAEPEEIDLLAGMPGRVVAVRPRRGAVIETNGALLQGVWGNNQRSVGAIRWEPEDGLEMIQGDALNLDWRGVIVITRKPLAYTGLAIVDEQDIAGVIAPSMDATLLELASNFNRAIMLTEGFGDRRMSAQVASFLNTILEAHSALRGTLDAVMPDALQYRRPELVMSVGTLASQPQPPKIGERLRPGTPVRIVTPPFVGQTGRIESAEGMSAQLEGGLRVGVADVRLSGGEVVRIPIANLEAFAG